YEKSWDTLILFQIVTYFPPCLLQPSRLISVFNTVIYLRSAYYAFFNSTVYYYMVSAYGAILVACLESCCYKRKLLESLLDQFDAHCRPLFTSEKNLTVINLYIYILLVCRAGSVVSVLASDPDGPGSNPGRVGNFN
ncbi:hypothetical protein C0J52_24672, partial [Blattella germanica]